MLIAIFVSLFPCNSTVSQRKFRNAKEPKVDFNFKRDFMNQFFDNYHDEFFDALFEGVCLITVMQPAIALSVPVKSDRKFDL